MKKRISSFLVGMCLVLVSAWMGTAQAQMIKDAIKWEKSFTNTSDGLITLTYKGTLKDGWHIYATVLPKGGPTATGIELEDSEGVTAVGELKADRDPEVHFDPNFDMDLKWYSGNATFIQQLQITEPTNFKVVADLIYMICNDQTCMPPTRETIEITPATLKTPLNMQSTTATKAVSDTEVDTTAEIDPAASTVEEPTQAVQEQQKAITGDKSLLWAPVVDELKAFGDSTLKASDSSLLMIFILGFLGGLVALLTPCVWPMIPMTVSFFLKRTKSRSKAISDAIIYGASIILIYLILGLLITGIFGASALNNLATNAVFNIIFFLLLVVFAVSFFGAFELVLPASWTNKLDSKAESTGGLLSIFFMAFTLVLVSFSCTGPIIGTLLVDAASKGDIFGPAIGMFGFALALALPFTLFAVFPNMLQSMPKSGGWLNSVKVVLGFLELALSLKFLSVADLAYGWGILDRETFVALWIIIFFLLGIYLLGKLKLPHDSDLKYVSVPRLFMALISLAFAVYMVPGLWGAPLKAISAFAPPLYTQDFNLYENEVHAKFDDYDMGMAYAKSHNLPVMIDFSGHGCVNCRKMEASVWTDPQVKSILEQDFVLITLMVDDKAKLPETIMIQEDGTERKLKTIGDKWSYFQRSKFGANAQPFYVMLDHDGKPLGTSYGFDENVENYIKWLRGGIDNFKNKK